MSRFREYMHIEKYGNIEVDGITDGECFIFSKLDGTNFSVWWDNGVCSGSRHRILTLEKDNAGFFSYVIGQENICNFVKDCPHLILYGEFLVPNKIKTYEKDAWRKAYVFDVYDTLAGRYLHYREYDHVLEAYGISYIPVITSSVYPTESQLKEMVDSSTYLIPQGQGYGEGIVIKNYEFVNKYGRTTWAKIIADGFKTKTRKKVYNNIEQTMCDKAIDLTLIEKEYNKIITINDGWSGKYIPRLLETVFWCLINEELYNVLKKLQYPTVNFKKLKMATIEKIKELKPELF